MLEYLSSTRNMAVEQHQKFQELRYSMSGVREFSLWTLGVETATSCFVVLYDPRESIPEAW